MARRLVVLGFLGVTLDRGGQGPKRWERWRPTVALCNQEEFAVDRLEIFVGGKPADRDLLAQLRTDIAQISPETTVRAHDLPLGDPWDFQEVYGALHGFASRYPFDPENEDYLVHITTGTHVAQICLFLLTETRHIPARLLQTGIARGIDPAVGKCAIIDLDLASYDAIAKRFEKEHAVGQSLLKSGIETRNAAFNRQMTQIELVAGASRAPILLTGPTGAGKSQLARRIFELKKQRHLVKGSFVEINCATIRGDAAMSALFGHKKGSFTGAMTDRPGLLRTADQGVLFLDEIGELGLDEQAMLLRALEDRTFLPVGSDREVRSDFELIAGTNRDLRGLVAAGRFRDDLLARIDLWTFELPSLRERIEDLAPNLLYELELFSTKTGRRVTFNKEAHERYLAFARSPEAEWRGNFRDLNASITRLATLAPQGRITTTVVDEEIARLRRSWQRPERSDDELVVRMLGEKRAAELDLFDKVQLAAVLAVCVRSRSLSEAGRVLFARSRLTRTTTNDTDRLRKYLLRYGLEWSALSDTASGG